MKIELEFTVDEYTGEPKITFKHHHRSTELNQKLLKVFINKGFQRGIQLKNTNGFLQAGTDNAWENFEIVLKPVGEPATFPIDELRNFI